MRKGECMSKFNGPKTKGSLSFYRKATSKNLIALTEAFDIDKAKIELRLFDQSQNSGNRITASIDFYISPSDLEVLCRDILSGRIAKDAALKKKQADGKFPEPSYRKEGASIQKMTARILTISSGSAQPFLITAYEGPGKKNDATGGIVPAYKYNEADTRIMIGMSGDDLKEFAVMGLRACDWYYQHYFGRYDPNLQDEYGRPLVRGY